VTLVNTGNTSEEDISFSHQLKMEISVFSLPENEKIILSMSIKKPSKLTL